MRRSLYLTFALVCAAAQTFSQMPLGHINDGVDLFQIGTSRSFSASRGGESIPEAPSTVSNHESRKIISDLSEAIEVIRANHVVGRQIDLNALTKSAISGALQTLDPHSSYFDATEYGDFLSEEQSESSGIGASITSFFRGQQYDTYVTSVIPGSPAAIAKLSFGDRILRVNGQSTAGHDTNDVSEAVRGSAGTMLSLTVERAATG